MLEAQNLLCEYNDGAQRLRVLDGVSLTVIEGTSVGIVGPSGSGKSSLLYLLAGLRLSSSGSVRFRGQSLEQLSQKARARLRAREFGFVFQQHFLVKHLTVMENIFVPVLTPTRETLAYAESLVERLGLKGMGHRFPAELSGGQRQRVALARALVNRPAIVFADEPTASLDRASAGALLDLLQELRGETTLVMVTHDLSILDRFDRIVELRDGQVHPGSKQVG